MTGTTSLTVGFPNKGRLECKGVSVFGGARLGEMWVQDKDMCAVSRVDLRSKSSCDFRVFCAPGTVDW